MRILITTVPGFGSLHPTLPLAHELRAAGHDVAFCSSASFRGPVEAAGFEHLAAGVDVHFSDPDYLDVLAAAAGGVTLPPPVGVDRLAWVTEHLFVGGSARTMVPDVCEWARSRRADLIVRESLEFAGCVAAEALGLPHVSIASPADGALDRRDRLAGPLAPLRRDAGLPADPCGSMVHRHLHLCSAPPTFDGSAVRVPDTVRYVRHVDGRTRAAPPAWAATERPLAVVSFGTVFHRTPGVYEAVVAALATEPVTAGVALGPDRDPGELGAVPPHVHVGSWLPVPRLLDRAAVLVTHGGFGSVKEAMSRGVPMVVAPIASDQHYSAMRLQRLGLAEVVPPQDRSVHRFRRAVRTVLDDPGYRSRAVEMAARMAALPPVSTAVGWLESLVAEPTARATGTGPRLSARLR